MPKEHRRTTGWIFGETAFLAFQVDLRAEGTLPGAGAGGFLSENLSKLSLYSEILMLGVNPSYLPSAPVWSPACSRNSGHADQ